MKRLLCVTVILSSLLLLTQCSKKDCNCTPPDPASKLTYGDSVFHLRSANYSIAPLNGKKGTYTAFPDNLRIDNTTGAITVGLKGTDGESQTGLWYKITYRSSTGNEVDST